MHGGFKYTRTNELRVNSESNEKMNRMCIPLPVAHKA